MHFFYLIFFCLLVVVFMFGFGVGFLTVTGVGFVCSVVIIVFVCLMHVALLCALSYCLFFCRSLVEGAERAWEARYSYSRSIIFLLLVCDLGGVLGWD